MDFKGPGAQQSSPKEEFNIMEYWLTTERPPFPDYMKWQPLRPSMRELLVNWLVQVHLKYKLDVEILYLSVSIIDRFLEQRTVPHTRLQLLGCAALLIASKHEDRCRLLADSLVRIAAGAFKKDELLKMETILFVALDFRVRTPTALQFGEHLSQDLSPKTRVYIRYYMELTLQEYSFVRFRASHIAMAALHVAIKRVCEEEGNQGSNKLNSTTKVCANDLHSRYCSSTDLHEVIQCLENLSTRTPNGDCCAVREKYSQELAKLEENNTSSCCML